MNNSFANKSILITGGSSGIGLALAKLMAASGANLWIIGRNIDKLSDCRELIEPLSNPSAHHQFLSVDISDNSALEKKLLPLINELGTPEILINSAGVTFPGEFLDIEIEQFHNLMDINYFGTVNMIKFLLPGMLERGSGHIINISSIAGYIGVYGYTAYSASKFALSGLTDALRSEFKSMGIRFSLVFPPDTQTPQLDFENKIKPAITKEIAGNAKAMSAKDVATSIVRGIKRKQYYIFPGTESRIMYQLKSLLGRAFYPIMDLIVENARKKTRKDSN